MKTLLQFKKKVQLLLMLVLMAPWLSNGLQAQTVTIGNPASTLYTYQLPINNLWYYSYTQQIIYASEIGMDGNITAIRFKYNTGSLTYNDNWTVLLGHTPLTAFASGTSWVPITSLTSVHVGTVTAAGGWITINLATPYPYYMALGNLVVAVDENSANYTYSSNMFPYNTSTVNRAIYYNSDGTNPSPESPPTGTITNRYNTIQLDLTPHNDCDTMSIVAGSIIEPDSVCAGKPFTLVTDGSTMAAGLQRVWQQRVPSGTGTWTTITGATGASVTFPGGISVPTDYRMAVTCIETGNTDTTDVHTVYMNLPTACYCIPSATYPTVNYITNVKTTDAVTNFDNTSTTGSLTSPGYSNYTATHSASAVQGTSFNFSVTEYGSMGNCMIWIDFNQNGSFADPGERVFAHTTGGLYTFTGSISVPTTATPGVTRMRVRTNWEYGTSLTDCTNMDYGEAEDYTFIVIEAIPCTSAAVTFPHSATAVANPNMVCGTGSTTLDMTTPMPVASGITYQWQSAPSATGPWTNISADLIDPYIMVPVVSADTYFRCLIKCSGTTVLTSSIAFVESVTPVAPVLNPAQTCGPGPVELTGSVGSGTIFWYDAATGGTMIGEGDTIMSPEITSTTTFYAAGGAFPSVLAQVGTSTSTSSSSSVGPFNIFYRRSTMQMMYKKDQIIAAGGYAGLLEDIRLHMLSAPSYDLPGFTISIKTVPATMTTLTWQTTGFTTIFGGPTFTYSPGAPGWKTYPIPGGMMWDGNSHIVIQVCFSAVPTWSSTGTHQYTTTPGQFLIYRDDSSGSACGLTGSSSSSELPNVIFNFQGCVTSRYPVIAYVRDTPVVTIPVLDGEYCVFNNEFSIPSTPEQPSTNSYLWSDGTTDTFMVAGPTYGDTETFWVSVTNEYGCTTTDSVKLVLNPSPDVDLGNDTLVCNGGVVIVDAGDGGTSYYWNTGENTQTIEIDDAGDYYVLVGNEFGCIGTDTIRVDVSEDYMPEVAGIIVENVSPSTFKFTPHHPMYVVSYEWDFGDGKPKVYSASPTHYYEEPGTYLVTLRVFSTCGNTIHTTYATIYTSNNDVEVNSKNLNVYPNPTNELLNLETLGNVKMSNIAVVNVLGQELMNSKLNNVEKHQINVGQYPSGTYYIKIDTDKGTIIKKFQITK